MSVLRRVRVRVPASTSNLGPGFDCLGMALGLYNDLVVEMHSEDGPSVVAVRGEGAGSLPSDEKNLMVQAAARAIAGRFKNRLVFKAVNRIPLARGLGSSAAAIVAGLAAGSRLARRGPLDREQIFARAAELEGHPDNAAPAVFGGVSVCVKDGASMSRFALRPHRDLVAVLCIPNFELATAKARAALPRTVPRATAVANISRALLLASAIERGRWDDLACAMEDSLHQPYRAPLIPGFSEVLAAARAAGACGAALSGSGSAMLALCRRGPRAAAIGAAMRRAFAARRVASRAVVLPIARQGVSVQE